MSIGYNLHIFQYLLNYMIQCSIQHIIYNIYYTIHFTIHIWVFPKIGVPPNHPFVNRVFHYFHHPFWGTSEKPMSRDTEEAGF